MRWVRSGLLIGWVLSMVGVGMGCQNPMYKENQELRAQNRELQAREDARSASQQPVPLTAEPIRPSEPQAKLVVAPAVTQPERVAPPPGPAPATADPLAGLETSVDPVAGTTTVNFVGDALFDPGQAILKSDAKTNLNKVAAVLKKQWAGKTVKVQGHTDSDPIKKSHWASNQDLSQARANAVRDYLISQGVDANHVTAEGFGDTKPKDPAKTSAAKAKNRRVEIVVVTR
jgi:flagellar motor protein MotB